MPVGSNVSKMASSGTRPTERLCSSKIPPISRSQFGCALRCPSHSFCLFVKKGAPGKRKRTSPRTKSRGLTRDLINKGDNGGRAPENAAAPTTRRPSASQSLCFSRNFLLGLALRPAWRFAGALKRRVERRALAMQAQASIERLFDRVQLIPNVCGRRVVRSNHDNPLSTFLRVAATAESAAVTPVSPYTPLSNTLCSAANSFGCHVAATNNSKTGCPFSPFQSTGASKSTRASSASMTPKPLDGSKLSNASPTGVCRSYTKPSVSVWLLSACVFAQSQKGAIFLTPSALLSRMADTMALSIQRGFFAHFLEPLFRFNSISCASALAIAGFPSWTARSKADTPSAFFQLARDFNGRSHDNRVASVFRMAHSIAPPLRASAENPASRAQFATDSLWVDSAHRQTFVSRLSRNCSAGWRTTSASCAIHSFRLSMASFAKSGPMAAKAEARRLFFIEKGPAIVFLTKFEKKSMPCSPCVDFIFGFAFFCAMADDREAHVATNATRHQHNKRFCRICRARRLSLPSRPPNACPPAQTPRWPFHGWARYNKAPFPFQALHSRLCPNDQAPCPKRVHRSLPPFRQTPRPAPTPTPKRGRLTSCFWTFSSKPATPTRKRRKPGTRSRKCARRSRLMARKWAWPCGARGEHGKRPRTLSRGTPTPLKPRRALWRAPSNAPPWTRKTLTIFLTDRKSVV